jgi:hypothetical protein
MVGSVSNTAQSVQSANVNPLHKRKDHQTDETRKAQDNKPQPVKAEAAGAQKSDNDSNSTRARQLAKAAHEAANDKDAGKKQQRGTNYDATV